MGAGGAQYCKFPGGSTLGTNRVVGPPTLFQEVQVTPLSNNLEKLLVTVL